MYAGGHGEPGAGGGDFALKSLNFFKFPLTMGRLRGILRKVFKDSGCVNTRKSRRECSQYVLFALFSCGHEGSVFFMRSARIDAQGSLERSAGAVCQWHTPSADRTEGETESPGPHSGPGFA